MSTGAVPFNDLGREYRAVQGEVDRAVHRVLASGWYVLGPEHDAFEHELAGFLGVGHVLGVASGTDALEISLRALGSGPGREVVTAGNAGGYAAVAARRTGAHVVVADVDPVTLLLDPAAAAAAVGPATVAVVVTHLYGRVADVGALRAALPPGTPVVEDCAQAVGATGPAGRCGAAGDLAALSFYPTKNLGALGDGGAVATSSAELADRVRRLRQYGWRDRYDAEVAGGGNSRLDEVQAAVLRVKLPHLDGWNARRRALLHAYADAARGSSLDLRPPGAGDVAHLAVGRHPRRHELGAALAGHGVATAVHYPVPDHRQRGLGAAVGPAGAEQVERACAEVISLPCSPFLDDDEVDRVCRAIGLTG